MRLWPSRHPAKEPGQKQQHKETGHDEYDGQDHLLQHGYQDAYEHQPYDDQRECERYKEKEHKKPEHPLSSSLHVRRLQVLEMRWRIGRFLFNSRADQPALRIVGSFPSPPEFPVPHIKRSRGRMRRWWWRYLLSLLVVMVRSWIWHWWELIHGDIPFCCNKTRSTKGNPPTVRSCSVALLSSACSVQELQDDTHADATMFDYSYN